MGAPTPSGPLSECHSGLAYEGPGGGVPRKGGVARRPSASQIAAAGVEGNLDVARDGAWSAPHQMSAAWLGSSSTVRDRPGNDEFVLAERNLTGGTRRDRLRHVGGVGAHRAGIFAARLGFSMYLSKAARRPRGG
jgi:hypothetical protein